MLARKLRPSGFRDVLERHNPAMEFHPEKVKLFAAHAAYAKERCRLNAMKYLGMHISPDEWAKALWLSRNMRRRD